MQSNLAMNPLMMQQAILMQYNMLQQQQQQGMMLPIQNQANNQLAQMLMMQGQGINQSSILGAPQVFPNVQMPAIQPVENGLLASNKEEESTSTKVGQTESV